MIDLGSLDFWAPVATSTALVGILAAAVSVPYRGWIEKRLQHGFDKKLEGLRSDFRREEDRLRAEMKSQDDRLAAMRSGALAGMAGRQAVLDRKRVEALEAIWAHCVASGPFKMAAKFAETINMKSALDGVAAGEDGSQEMKDFAGVVFGLAGLDKITAPVGPIAIDQHRPFAPPLVWALFGTYRQVLMLPTAQLVALRNGVGSKYLADTKPLIALAKAALPGAEEALDKFGPDYLPYLVPMLEEQLLTEVVRALNDTASDANSVARAAEIEALVHSAEGARIAAQSPGAPN